MITLQQRGKTSLEEKKEEKMLKSLINTGLEARLTPEQHALYRAELIALEESWKQSLHFLECNFNFDGSGVEPSKIPTPRCQYDYNHIIYDYRTCRELQPGETLATSHKTMADGGTVPCALLSVLEYYCRDEKLPELGQILVKNGYRTQNNGTLLIALDKIPELVYGIQTQVQSFIFNLFESVCMKKPVIALVSAAWLHDFPKMPSNECIVIWRLEGKTALITTTSHHSVRRIDLYDLLKNIKRAWSFQIMD